MTERNAPQLLLDKILHSRPQCTSQSIYPPVVPCDMIIQFFIDHQNSDFHFIYPSHNISCLEPQHDQGIGMIPAIMVSCYNYLPLMFDSFAMI